MNKAIGLFSVVLCLAGSMFAAVPQEKRAVLNDFDGDGRSDLTVFRPADGRWHISRSSEGGFQTTFGVASDTMVPADYDGDGKTDIAVYRPSEGTWHVVQSSTGTITQFKYGLGSDIPVPADYDGDGKADMAVYRPSEGQWWINLSTGATGVARLSNGLNDIPAHADLRTGPGQVALTLLPGGVYTPGFATVAVP